MMMPGAAGLESVAQSPANLDTTRLDRNGAAAGQRHVGGRTRIAEEGADTEFRRQLVGPVEAGRKRDRTVRLLDLCHTGDRDGRVRWRALLHRNGFDELLLDVVESRTDEHMELDFLAERNHPEQECVNRAFAV